MVLKDAARPEHPRRIVNYYLLFSLVTVVWLIVFSVIVVRSVVESRDESDSIAYLSRAVTRCEMSYLRHGAEGLKEDLASIAQRGRFLYCAVVGADGNYMAHSDPSRIGVAATELDGRAEPLGDVLCVHYTDADGNSRRRYRIPLVSRDQQFGELEIAMAEPDAMGLLLRHSELVPIALLGPLFILIGGAFVLRHLARPLADIEAQLTHIARATTAAAALRAADSVKVCGAATVGWNRLVQVLQETLESEDAQQRIQRALQSRNDAQFDRLLNSLPEGIAASDTDGHITFANQTFRALVGDGTDHDSLANKSVPDCLALPQQTPDSPLLQPAMAGRRVVDELAQADGTDQRVLRIARFPVRGNAANKPQGHVWSVRDITQQKLAEQTRDQFLDSATHELRTPLANIKAYAETLVLSEMLDVDQQKEFCNTINTEATRLTRLIDDLLSVASMEAGSLVITRERVELDRLLKEIIGKVSAQLEQKNVVFETVFSPKLPELSIDKDKIAAALVNLLGNAAKYTPAGGRVALKAHVTENRVIIEVEDTGIGIAEDELPQVFNRFFRSDDRRVRETTGTGLGLAMAHEVIKLHGGTLSVQSVLNEGSTFTVTMPLDA